MRLNQVIEQDPAIQRYFTVIRAKARNKGHLSQESSYKALKSARLFLTFLKIPLSENALTNLIQKKRNNPSDFTIDDANEVFGNLQPLRSHRSFATYINGIFRANRAPLTSKIDCHFNGKTAKISEGVLTQIFNDTHKRTETNRHVSSVLRSTNQLHNHAPLRTNRPDTQRLRNSKNTIIPKQIKPRPHQPSTSQSYATNYRTRKESKSRMPIPKLPRLVETNYPTLAHEIRSQINQPLPTKKILFNSRKNTNAN